MDCDRRPTSHYFYLGHFSFLFSFSVFIIAYYRSAVGTQRDASALVTACYLGEGQAQFLWKTLEQ